MSLFERFAVAHPFAAFLSGYGTPPQQERWRSFGEQVTLTSDQVTLLKKFKRETNVLVLAGVWCGDCSSQCPIFEKFAEVAPCLKIKYIDRDEHADVQKLLQVNGGNRVPVAVFFSEDGHEVARFGDRPLSRYRQLVQDKVGESCSTGISSGPDPTVAAVVQDWLDQFERVQWILRLSPGSVRSTKIDPSFLMALVRISNLVKTYANSGSEIPVLRGIDLTIEAGERIALLGKSGSGKSTLLNLLGGLDEPTSGTIEIDGHDLSRFTSNERARHRLSTVGLIFQAFHLIPSKTTLENIELPMIFAGIVPITRRIRARESLVAVGLGDRASHLPNQLSGGERQRVAIARALVNQPRLVLADEPTGNLDSTTGREVIDLMMHHVETHQSTLILVTHDEELASRCATRILRVNDGRLVGD